MPWYASGSEASGRHGCDSNSRALAPLVPVRTDHEGADVDVSALIVDTVADAELPVEREPAGLSELDADRAEETDPLLGRKC